MSCLHYKKQRIDLFYQICVMKTNIMRLKTVGISKSFIKTTNPVRPPFLLDDLLVFVHSQGRSRFKESLTQVIFA